MNFVGSLSIVASVERSILESTLGFHKEFVRVLAYLADLSLVFTHNNLRINYIRWQCVLSLPAGSQLSSLCTRQNSKGNSKLSNRCWRNSRTSLQPPYSIDLTPSERGTLSRGMSRTSSLTLTSSILASTSKYCMGGWTRTWMGR